jgi:hypothetical protein
MIKLQYTAAGCFECNTRIRLWVSEIKVVELAMRESNTNSFLCVGQGTVPPPHKAVQVFSPSYPKGHEAQWNRSGISAGGS